MSKIYVLDTSVIYADHSAPRKFEDNDVVIPLTVLKELDHRKEEMNKLAKRARDFSNSLEHLRSVGNLADGVETDTGGTLSVLIPPKKSDVYDSLFLAVPDTDSTIVALAKQLQESQDKEVVVVSKDTNLRILANTHRISAENYRNDKAIKSLDEQYDGYIEFPDAPQELVNKVRKGVKVPLDELPEHISNLELNQFIKFNKDVIAVNKGQHIEKLFVNYSKPIYGILPKNSEQLMSLQHLMDDSIEFLSLTGKAGTGKTLLALATGLHKVQEESEESGFRKVLCYRAIADVGEGLGFLPGDLNEKLQPWTQPIYDNLEVLFDTKKDGEIGDIIAGMSKDLEVGAVNFIRGRSIPGQFIIIDEAQNLTKHEIKTLATRAGKGTKIILIGDPDQIDHPYLDVYSNGLAHASEKMKPFDLSGHVNLVQGERSRLAEICANVL